MPIPGLVGLPRLPRLGQTPVPQIDPEEQQSILGRVMGTLETAGNILDTPRAMAWETLRGGNPFAVANPFNREAVAARPTGWDLMKSLGIEGQEGFDWTDIPAVASEIIGDPLLYARGPLAALTAKGMKASKAAGPKTIREGLKLVEAAGKGTLKAGKAIGASPSAVANELRSGERTLGALAVPFTNARVNFNWGLKPEQAAKAYEAVNFGKYSPVPYLRELTSPIVSGAHTAWMGTGGKLLNALPQFQHDIAYSRMRDYLGIRDEIAPLVRTWMDENGKLWDDVGKYAQMTGGQKFANLDEFVGYIGEKKTANAQKIVTEGATRERFQTINPAEIQALFAQGGDMAVVERLAKDAYDFADDLKAINATAYDMIHNLGGKNEVLADMYAQHMARHGTKIPIKGAKPREMQFIRAAFPEANHREAIFKMPGGTPMAQRVSQDPLLTATKEGDATALQNALTVEGQQLGITAQPGMSVGDYQSEYLWKKYLAPEVEQDVTRGFTTAEEATAIEQAWTKGTPEAMGVAGKPALSGTLVDYLGRQPKEILEKGIFGRGLVEDWMTYQKHAAVALANLGAAHSLVDKLASIKMGTETEKQLRGKMTLAQAWKDAKVPRERMINGRKAMVQEQALQDEGLKTFVRKFFESPANQSKLTQPEMAQLGEIIASKPGDAFGVAKALAEKVLVDDRLPGVLSKYVEINGPDMRTWLGKAYDWANHATKGALTWPWPAFHVRNRIDSLWRNTMRAGTETYSLKQLFKAEYDLLKVGKDQVQKSGVRAIESLPNGKDYLEQLKGVFGPVPEAEFAEFAPKHEPIGTLKQILTGTTEGAANAALDTSGIVKKGLKAYPNLMGRLYQYTEFANRYPVFAAAMANGKSATQAMALASEIQFQYGKRLGGALPGSMARSTLPRIVPFWSFVSQNIPFQLRQLMNLPGGGTAQTLRLFSHGRESAEGYVPGWMREQTAIRVGGEEEAANFIRSFGLSLEQIGIPVWDTSKGIGSPFTQRTLEKALAQTSPMFQLPFKLFAGKDPYTGRPTKEMEGPFKKAGLPGIMDTVIQSTPASRGVGTAMMLGDERKSALQKALDLLTGVKVGTYNLPKQKTYETEAAINKLLESHPDVRQFTRSYVPAAEKATADPEAIRLLGLLNALERQRAALAKRS